MNESKLELTERLRAEGRWDEAAKFRETARADFRSKGMKRAEAVEAAWEAMSEAFPPLPVAEAPADPGAPESAPTHAPPVPWADLPTDADFADEVRWVHQQYIRIVEETPRGRVIHWERASVKPPSTGACSLARWAAENRTAFYKDMLPRVMAKLEDGAEEETNIRRERMALDEIDELLGEMNKQIAEELAEELRAGVSAAVQKRVQELVSKWSQSTWDHAPVSVPDDARASLEADVCGLIRDCIAAVRPAAGGE